MSVLTRPGRVAAVTALVLVAAACSTPPAPTSSPVASPATSPGPSTAPSAAPSASPSPVGLLLEVTTEGGFINPAASLGALPQLVVDDDGRIYTPAAPGADPQGIIAAADVRSTGADGEAAILAAIRQAGLDHQEAGGGVAADTGTTVFTAVIDGETVVNRFAAGGPGGPGVGGPGIPGVGGPGAAGGSAEPGASGGASPAATAFALLARLTDPTQAWGATASAPAHYDPDGYRVFAAPAGPVDSTSGSPAPAWPLATALGDFGTPAVADLGVTGLRSGVVTGPDATTLGTALATVPAGSTLTSGGQAWTVWVRPLFPDELGG